MALYSIHSSEKYRALKFDDKQIHEVFGDDIHNQFTVNYAPVSYEDKWQILNINFDDDGAGLDGDLIPDISAHYGRLFLSQAAYEALKGLLEGHGEFLPVRYKGESAYIFNPLHKAEEVDGLDTKLSVRDEWGDIENTAFHEERVKDFVIFKTEFDHFISAYCDQALKDAVEEADLKGVFFTTDLGNPFGVGATQ